MTLMRLLFLIATTIFIAGCTPQGNKIYTPIWDKDEIYGLKIIQSQISSEIRNNEQTVRCELVLKNDTDHNFENFEINIMYPGDWPSSYQSNERSGPKTLNAGEQIIYNFERSHVIDKKSAIISAKKLQKVSIHFTFNLGDTTRNNGLFHQK